MFKNKIIYTITDESPQLATYSLLPILRAFASTCNIDIETKDISLSARILANFPDRLTQEQRVPDDLHLLSSLVQDPDINIIKLPNISASLYQLQSAIKELQNAGYNLPDYYESPATTQIYDKIKGSAVNPILREGNSLRIVPSVVKNYTKAHPHKLHPWTPESKTSVATMQAGDFFHNEQSVFTPAKTTLKIVLTEPNGSTQVLADEIHLAEGAIVDATYMSYSALTSFINEQIDKVRDSGTLFSVHLKATMMKVSDPIIFGAFVRAFLPTTFAKYSTLFKEHKITENGGIASILDAIKALPQQAEILKSIEEDLASMPPLAYVNSAENITNLHMPNNTIIDASMPAMIRVGGKMYNKSGQLQDALAVIPDSTYAGVYSAVIEDCKENGALNPTTIGSVCNVGLMAKKAEEYGSHPTTFQINTAGTVALIDQNGNTLTSHTVSVGDIYRVSFTLDSAIENWVQLSVETAHDQKVPIIFWLSNKRPHENLLMQRTQQILKTLDTSNIEFSFSCPKQSTQYTLARMRQGLNTISATGNVLRDYLTDLFPILELGTSSKMLSIVPFLQGGGMFETGAGGSAPKHVEQLRSDNHLRWDSLGEFLAIAQSLHFAAKKANNPDASILADALTAATETVLHKNLSPQRLPGQADTRTSHMWLAVFWAQELAKQNANPQLARKFQNPAHQLTQNAPEIESQILTVQNCPVDTGGYYFPCPKKLNSIMRPSALFNQIIDSI